MDLIRQLADTGDQSRPRGDRDIAVRARIHEHLSDLRLLWTMPDTPLGDSFDGSISGRTWLRFADGKLGRFTQKISDRPRVTGIEGGAKWIDEFNEAFEFSPAGDPMLAGDRKLCVRQHGAFISCTMVLNALERRGVAPDGVTKQVFGLLLILLEIGTQGQRGGHTRPSFHDCPSSAWLGRKQVSTKVHENHDNSEVGTALSAELAASSQRIATMPRCVRPGKWNCPRLSPNFMPNSLRGK